MLLFDEAQCVRGEIRSAVNSLPTKVSHAQMFVDDAKRFQFSAKTDHCSLSLVFQVVSVAVNDHKCIVNHSSRLKAKLPEDPKKVRKVNWPVQLTLIAKTIRIRLQVVDIVVVFFEIKYIQM